MKQLFIFLFSIFFSAKLAAQDTTTVYFNNKKVARAIIKAGQPEALLLIKKTDIKKYGIFMIKVCGEHVGGELYKRSLEIVNVKSSYIEETKNKPGYFDISSPVLKKQLTFGKKVSLYLVMDPSNPRMKIPSKRIYLGNLVMK